MKRLLLIAALLAACGKRPGTGNGPPEPRILAPADGAQVAAGAPLTLRGAPATLALLWASDLQGALGTGAELTVSLRAGRHLIALTATDSAGQSATAQITVTAVAAENHPPSAFIDAPSDNAQVDEGQSVTLSGHATDPEDGALPASALSWTSSLDGAWGTGASVVVTPRRGQHHVVLTATDRQGASAYASITLNVVPAGANHPPVATIAAPQDGASFVEGSSITFTGSGSDVEDGAAVALSWSSSLDGALGTGASVTTNSLRRGAHVVTLTATDSSGATGTAQIAISVVQRGNHPPVPTISAPADGTAVFAGTPVTFSGSATDVEDGTVSALSWSSDRDGALGSGASITTSSLSVGAHVVSLTATDSAGDSATASIQLTVLAQNQPPVATISSPADGAQLDEGQTVQLRGAAQDPEDGALSGASLTWTSSLDGVLGHGASLDTQSLRAGSHTLTLTATDSGGRTGSAQVAITVRVAQVNLPPIARIQAPAQGLTQQDLAFDGSASSDPDGSIASYAWSFGDGATASGATTTHRYGAAGNYTVSLTVTDNQGATASASATISITEPVRIPGLIDSGPDAFGGTCAIALSGSSVLIAYHDDTHPAVKLATVGASTQLELVDGMGYDVGGAVAKQLDLKVASDGTPHLAYALENGQARWAAKSAGAWLRERVDVSVPRITSSTYRHLALALKNDAPVVAYNSASGAVTIAVRGAAWSDTQLPATNSYSSIDNFVGGLDVLGDGSIQYTAYNGGVRLATWASGAPTSIALAGAYLFGDYFGLAPLSHGAVLTGTAVFTGALASPFEESAIGWGAITTDAQGAVWLAYDHGGDLEVIHSAPGGYWSRTDLGPMDSATPGIAVDASGSPHVCFFRSQRLMLY